MAEQSRAVFISYASEDAESARRICEALRAAGLDVWFDQSELRGGDAWDQKIRQQIRDCTLFIPIISANTVSRHEGYFRLEWALAEQRSQMIARNRAFIVPVCVDKTSDTASDVPESFQRVQWTRLPAGETPAAFTDRIRHLRSPDQPSLESHSVPRSSYSENAKAVTARFSSPSKIALFGFAAVVIFAGGYFALHRLIHTPQADDHRGTLAASAPSIATAQMTIPDKSIAVLPFLDLSEKRDQEYFSDGLSEELIDVLAQSPDLQVIARTSSFYFKGKQVTITEIAKTLGVAHVLEGSVRKSGSKLRVTAQLIRADTGAHLWSKTYDRDAKDIFKVQDEVAAAVLLALESTLSVDKTALHGAASGDRTDNLDAYALLLQGRYLKERASESELRSATQVLMRAVNLDPAYAAAWQELADVYLRLSNYFDSDPNADMELARDAIQKAVALNPDNAAARYQMAIVKIVFDHDPKGAAADIEAARGLDPSLTEPMELALVTGCLAGPCYEKYNRDLSRDIEHDPLNADAVTNRGYVEYLTGEFDTAEADSRRGLVLSPNLGMGNFGLARVLLARHKFADALAVAKLEAIPYFRRAGLALCYLALNRGEEADASLKDLLDRDSNDAGHEIAQIYAIRKDNAAALDWLERDFRDRRSGVLFTSTDPELRSLAPEPRFIALLHRIGFID